MAQMPYYPVVGNGQKNAPDYSRVVALLNEEELEEEIQSGRGESDYKLALVAEHKRRARPSPDLAALSEECHRGDHEACQHHQGQFSPAGCRCGCH